MAGPGRLPLARGGLRRRPARRLRHPVLLPRGHQAGPLRLRSGPHQRGLQRAGHAAEPPGVPSRLAVPAGGAGAGGRPSSGPGRRTDALALPAGGRRRRPRGAQVQRKSAAARRPHLGHGGRDVVRHAERRRRPDDVRRPRGRRAGRGHDGFDHHGALQGGRGRLPGGDADEHHDAGDDHVHDPVHRGLVCGGAVRRHIHAQGADHRGLRRRRRAPGVVLARRRLQRLLEPLHRLRPHVRVQRADIWRARGGCGGGVHRHAARVDRLRRRALRRLLAGAVVRADRRRRRGLGGQLGQTRRLRHRRRRR
mmetsp:Transcript_41538/g.125494  ORF Transcript_41538/g.125494 Transcript_41538/m.125494 type:complete len:308 (+) Transcript_41538:647-1570(+)